MKKLTFLLILPILISLSSCKEDTPTVAKPGNAKIELFHKVGNQNLVLNTGSYTNDLGEPYTISMFNYFISNISLKKSDGSVFTYPKDKSYFLVEGNNASSHILNLQNIDGGDYTEISFILGVDSAKNYAPAEEHVGALDPANGMYWTWSSGHIFWKLEGNSPVANNALNKFVYHIAGAGGTPSTPVANNIRKITLPFTGSSLKITEQTTPEIHLNVDISKVFNATPPFSIEAYPNIMTMTKESSTLADNASKMFLFKEIH